MRSWKGKPIIPTTLSAEEIGLYFSSEIIQRKRDFENFGDLLSKELVEKISGRPVRWRGYDVPNILFGIGSILKKTSGPATIWGSGIKAWEDGMSDQLEIKALRGRFSYLSAIRNGNTIQDPLPFGDPGLLAPKYYRSEVKRTFKLGVVPHFVDLDEITQRFADEGTLVVDVRKPVQEVIQDINSCEMTLCSSLHGIIISHAYGIPSLWAEFSDKITGDGVKYLDYFSSVNIPFYHPFDGRKRDDELVNRALQFIEENQPFNRPQADINPIQQALLDAFPYPC